MDAKVPFKDQPTIVQILITVALSIVTVALLVALLLLVGFGWRAIVWVFS